MRTHHALLHDIENSESESAAHHSRATPCKCHHGSNNSAAQGGITLPAAGSGSCCRPTAALTAHARCLQASRKERQEMQISCRVRVADAICGPGSRTLCARRRSVGTLPQAVRPAAVAGHLVLHMARVPTAGGSARKEKSRQDSAQTFDGELLHQRDIEAVKAAVDAARF